ncbi:MAG: fused MFS/spermidine synthase, partial [Candidatus Sericytochromatia bacterium]|nr:fused MFS/spermidine synthase [Candidatus Tanganyikabacteria bacterium]
GDRSRGDGSHGDGSHGDGSHGERKIRLLMFAVFASGFVSLAYEIAWIRLLSLVLGSSAYSFALMLGAFIAGIALGSLLVNRGVLPGSDPLRQFAIAQAGIALLVSLTIPLYDHLPLLAVRLGNVIVRSPETFGLFQGLQFGVAALLMLPPTTCIGMTLPLAARAATRSLAAVGEGVGGVFGLNTLGNVLGAIVAGIWLLPLLGIRGLIEAGMAANALLAGLIWLAAWRPPRAWRGAALAAPLLIVALARLLAPAWNMETLSAGVFRFRGQLPAEATSATFKGDPELLETLYHRDDAHGTVTVTRTARDLKLRVNGKVDATAQADLGTQILLGQLPLTLRPGARDVLVIGLGSGITVGSALAHPVSHVDVVEISPAVAEAARFFAPHNRGALEDPRARLHVADALAFLQLARKRYDVVISEPSNPWMAGVGNLFTREFYAMARARLAPGGLFAQWIHVYEMDDETVSLVLRTFADAFPAMTVWLMQGRDYLLVGSAEPLRPDFAASERMLGAAPVRGDLARLGIGGLAELLALQTATDRRARRLAGDGPRNTLRFPLLEYRAPIAFFANSSAGLLAGGDERLKAPTGTGRDMLLPAYLRAAGRALAREEFARIVAYQEARHVLPAVARTYAAEWARRFPADPAAWSALARGARKAGDEGAARVAAAQVLRLAPRDPVALALVAELNFARYLDDAGFLADPAGAAARVEASLGALLSASPEKRPETLRRMAAIRLAIGDFAGASDRFSQAAAATTDPAEVARLWVAAAAGAAEQEDIAWARRFAGRALALRPADAKLRAIVDAMVPAAAASP